MLWVALEMPALPLQLAERARAEPLPLVVGEGPAQRPVVACANAAARAAGVREGMAVAAAKALASDLRCVDRDEAAERDALERLAGWAAQYTPAVSVEPTGLVLEVEGSVKLFGGLAKLLAALRGGVRALGLQATVGVAPTPLAARAFARAEARGMAVRSCTTLSDLPARLAELPLFLLEWPGRTLEHLSDLGVLRVKDALALPRAGFSQRFGPEALAVLDRLAGRAPDPRLPHVPPARYRARLELPAEAEGVEAILFPLKRLLAEMEGYLRGRGAGVQELDLVLEHGRRSQTRLALSFASPEREAEFILVHRPREALAPGARRAHGGPAPGGRAAAALRAARGHVAAGPRGARRGPGAPRRAPRRAAGPGAGLRHRARGGPPPRARLEEPAGRLLAHALRRRRASRVAPQQAAKAGGGRGGPVPAGLAPASSPGPSASRRAGGTASP